ncbi:MAG TPA: hypothetical protein VHW00_11955 [Thermoanaerobaculia bacterium]|nr:hypothetical protein [Thermoanaerobaculia bacterium]
MSKVVITAEYDSETKTITVREPLEGVRLGTEVRVEVPPASFSREERQAHLQKLRGAITDPSFHEAIESMFPPWNDPDDV